MTRHPRFLALGTLLTVLLLGTSCASTSTGDVDADDRTARASGATSQVITAEQIMAGSASNAWDAIRDHVRFVFFREDPRGNPQMATRRGNTSMMGPEDVRVMVDGSAVQDLRDLLLIPVQTIHEIRVLSAVDATTYFGTNSGAGAVLIVTR